MVNNDNKNVLFLGVLILLSEKIAVFRLEIVKKYVDKIFREILSSFYVLLL